MKSAVAKAKLGQEEKLAAADVVIDGSAAKEETRRQVEHALSALSGAAG